MGMYMKENGGFYRDLWAFIGDFMEICSFIGIYWDNMG